MDALEFIKTAQRYTKAEGYDTFEITKLGPPEEMLKRMEQWAEEHPIRTRQSELLEIFPNANLAVREEYVDICPYFIESDLFRDLDCTIRSCPKCKKEFWLGEIDNG